MKCPRCRDVTLLLSERERIEIDYCPECRGVWLDRGELDKLIERADAPDRARYDDRDDDRDRDRDRGRDRDDDRRRGIDRDRDDDYRTVKPKKRKGLFSELFEFGD